MRIEIEGNRVVGYVDYAGNGETDVISIYIDRNEMRIGSSMCLPTRYIQAKLVLACMNEAFIKAEALKESRR